RASLERREVRGAALFPVYVVVETRCRSRGARGRLARTGRCPRVTGSYAGRPAAPVPVEKRSVVRHALARVLDQAAQMPVLIGNDFVPRRARMTRHVPPGRENVPCRDHPRSDSLRSACSLTRCGFVTEGTAAL